MSPDNIPNVVTASRIRHLQTLFRIFLVSGAGIKPCLPVLLLILTLGTNKKGTPLGVPFFFFPLYNSEYQFERINAPNFFRSFGLQALYYVGSLLLIFGPPLDKFSTFGSSKPKRKKSSVRRFIASP
jgi:hypothetical protein